MTPLEVREQYLYSPDNRKTFELASAITALFLGHERPRSLWSGSFSQGSTEEKRLRFDPCTRQCRPSTGSPDVGAEVSAALLELFEPF